MKRRICTAWMILSIIVAGGSFPAWAQKIFPAPEQPGPINPADPVFVIRPPARTAQTPAFAPPPTARDPQPAGDKKDIAIMDQIPGQPIKVQAIDLPPPQVTSSPGNPPSYTPRAVRSTLTLPDGFVARPWVRGLNNPRFLAVLPNGDVAVSEQAAGRISLVRDVDQDGQADRIGKLADGLNQPSGLAVQGDFLYFADTARVWRLPLFNGVPRPGVAPQPVTVPGALGGGRGHNTRGLLFHPKGDRFYVSIGSADNLAEEPIPRASIQEFSQNGQLRRTFAYGLRNPVGMAFYPGDGGKLFTVVNERDGLGDGLVPDFLTEVADGGFYGWPYAYLGPNLQPDLGAKRPDMVSKTIVPDLLFLAHSAPTSLLFYTGDQFPRRYRDGAFVTLHGSWNRRQPVGYSVAFVPFRDGKPTGLYEPFATGFWVPPAENRQDNQKKDLTQAEIWGRPAGLAMLADGSLLVSDDLGGTIWRISYP